MWHLCNSNKTTIGEQQKLYGGKMWSQEFLTQPYMTSEALHRLVITLVNSLYFSNVLLSNFISKSWFVALQWKRSFCCLFVWSIWMKFSVTNITVASKWLLHVILRRITQVTLPHGTMASCARVTMPGQLLDSFEKFTRTFSIYLSLILFYDDKAHIDTLMSVIVS